MTEHTISPPTCQHVVQDEYGADLQCTRPGSMVHTVHAGTAEGQPIRGTLYYCDVHSPVHQGDPRTLSVGTWPTADPTLHEFLDDLEAHLVPGGES